MVRADDRLRAFLPNGRSQSVKSQLSTSRRKRAQRFRGLERLEERVVPSTVTWIAGSGNWDEKANWIDSLGVSRIPENGDDVIIPAAGSPTVTARASVDLHSLTSQANLVIESGSLGLEAASTITGSLTMTGGTLNAAGGLTETGAFHWSGGSIYGTNPCLV